MPIALLCISVGSVKPTSANDANAWLESPSSSNVFKIPFSLAAVFESALMFEQSEQRLKPPRVAVWHMLASRPNFCSFQSYISSQQKEYVIPLTHGGQCLLVFWLGRRDRTWGGPVPAINEQKTVFACAAMGSASAWFD
jgi:hypothetical protein